MALTVKQIDAARPKEKPYKLADAAGLYLFVSVAGGKSWRCNYSKDGKQATRTYGRYPDLSLADARRAHADFKEGPKEKAKPTFEQIAEQWLKGHLPTLSNGKHQIQVAETLKRHVYPMIGAMPIDTIKRTDLVRVIRAVSDQGIIETAHRVAGRICMVFDHAVDTGEIEHHGAAGLVRVIAKRPKVKHMASIAPEEAPALLAAIAGYPEPVTHLGLQLLAYLFVRTSELRWMEWNEIVWDDAVWVIPEDRMKARILHVVPLAPPVMKLLEHARLSATSQYVLESPLRPKHPISENTLLFALYRLGYRGKMTGHGFRALASTVLNSQSGFPADVIERQLAHKEVDAVRAAYNRAEYLPERRALMKWWADWIGSRMPPAGPSSASASPRQS